MELTEEQRAFLDNAVERDISVNEFAASRLSVSAEEADYILWEKTAFPLNSAEELLVELDEFKESAEFKSLHEELS